METSVTKKIAKNYSWLMIGSLISGTLNFITGIYIARVLGAFSFGLFRFAQAFLSYLVLMVDSGLSLFGTCEIAKNKGKAKFIFINLLVVRLILALLIYFFAFSILWLLPLSGHVRFLFLFVFGYVFYRALNTNWVFQGLEEMKYIATAKVLYAIAFFSFTFLFVKSADNLLSVPLVQSISGIVIALLFLLFLFRVLFSADKANISLKVGWRYFLISLPLGASSYLIQVYNSMDSIMLGVMDKTQVVGYYGAAYQIYYIVLAFFILWQSTAIPVASRRIKENKEKAKVFLQKYLRLTLLLIVPTAFFVSFIAPLIINIFYGSEYAEAIPALRILVWTIIPCVIGYTYGNLILIPSGKYNAFLISVAGGAVVNLVFNFALIPRFSYIGAAVATILAEVVVGVIAIYLAMKIFRLGIVKVLVKPLLFSFIAILPFLLVSNVLFGAIAFIMIYLAFGLLFEHRFMFDFVKEVVRRDA